MRVFLNAAPLGKGTHLSFTFSLALSLSHIYIHTETQTYSTVHGSRDRDQKGYLVYLWVNTHSYILQEPTGSNGENRIQLIQCVSASDFLIKDSSTMFVEETLSQMSSDVGFVFPKVFFKK